MCKRNEPGLIRYSFGTADAGPRALLNLRTLLLGLVTAVLLAILFIAIVDRPTASLKVAVSHTAASRLFAGDLQGTFFNAWINDRSQASTVYRLQARRKESGEPLVVKGQLRAELAPGENRRLDFILLTPASEQLEIEFVLVDGAGLELLVAKAYIEVTTKELSHD